MAKLCIRCGVGYQRPSKVWCNDCSKAYERERWGNQPVEQRRAKWLKSKYKLTWTEYATMYEEQDGKCKVCSTEISIVTTKNSAQTACVDHNHTTGQIRNLLCNHCNRAIGLMKEDPTTMKNMLEYLERWNG